MIEPPEIMPKFEKANDTPCPFDPEKHKLVGLRLGEPDNVRILFPGLYQKDGHVWRNVKAAVVSSPVSS